MRKPEGEVSFERLKAMAIENVKPQHMGIENL